MKTEDRIGTPAAQRLSSEEKRALLTKLLREKLRTTKTAHPLSHNQRSMWFLHRLAPDSAAYNAAFPARIRSTVDVPALRRAFQQLVDRHASLRTVFTTVAGELVQEVYGRQEVCFEEIDASAWSEDTLQTRVIEAYRRPFDLAEGPVFRVALFRRSVDDHVLLITAHHIAIDGWSVWILLDELRALYAAERSGTPTILPPPTAQYTDYVRWQADMLAGARGEALRAYWQTQLAGASPVLDLPTDRPRPTFQTFNGASCDLELGPALTRQLRALAQAERTTLYTTTLAAFQVLLHRYSGQDDVIVGSPTAGRSRPEFADVVGDCINTTPMRADLSGDPTFREFLGRTRETVLRALEHQDYPLSLLVEQLALPHDPSRSPLFQVTFDLQRIHRVGELAQLFLPCSGGAAVDVGGLLLEPFPLPQQEGQMDLSLQMAEVGDSLIGSMRYNTDLFEAETIARLVEHFRTLLAGVVADPDQRLSALPLLPPAEREQVLVHWNATATPAPAAATLPALVEAQVARTPEAVAVVAVGEQLTYHVLNQRANQLAHHLQAQGVGPGQLVGLCLERSAALLVGALGILKAGAAYVPLDPTYPPDRLAFMLADAQVPLVVTQASLVGSSAAHGAPCVCLDADAAALAAAPATNPSSGACDDDLAYVIYTSGSTGQPKGVQVPHRAVVNFLTAMAHEPGLTAADTLLAVTTLSFDIAVLELYLPLVVGARVVIVSREVSADGRQLAAMLAATGATVLQATPVTWQLLVAAGWSGQPGLTALCGGEALPPELAAALLARGCRLWNMYGPTETTVWSTVQRVDAADGPIPIGHPIANTEVYVLDAHRQPLPIGIPGDLYIGGAGLAAGYRGRPDLTAERFVPHPFSSVPGARLYHTGDRARWRPDGTLEHLGRSDTQVKLRGFRIELGEIEVALGRHPAVGQAVVVLREDVPGNPRLVAYLQPEGAAPTPAALRTFLKATLPEYMVPSAFVTVEAFPRTPNGKLDRRALPPPDSGSGGDRESTLPARNEVEASLVRIWEEMLGTAPIGIRDDFFDLGGHSLLAVRVFARIREEFGKNLPLTALLEEPTIEHMAHVLTGATMDSRWSCVVPIQASGSKPPFFCVHGLGGYVNCFADLSRYLGSDQPFYGIQALGLDGVQEPPTTVEEMAGAYLAEVRAVQPHGPYYLGGFSLGGAYALEMAQQLRAQGEDVALLVMFDHAPHTLADRRSRWKPSSWQELRRDFPFWLEVLRSYDRAERIAAVRYACTFLKWAVVTKIAALRAPEQATNKVRELLEGPDVAGLPEHHRRLRRLLWEAVWAYRLRPYPGRITLLRSTRSFLLHSYDRYMGWTELALGGVEMDIVPGDHEGVIAEPHVPVLAQKLAKHLACAQAREVRNAQSAASSARADETARIAGYPLLSKS